LRKTAYPAIHSRDLSTARHVLLKYASDTHHPLSRLERTITSFTHKTRRIITAHKGVEFGLREAAKISSNIGTYPLQTSTSARPNPFGCRVVPLLINTISFVYHLYFHWSSCIAGGYMHRLLHLSTTGACVGAECSFYGAPVERDAQ
jgi:hypothetical protein